MAMRKYPNRSPWLSVSNILYALLTIVALLLFMQDAQAISAMQSVAPSFN